MDFLDHRIDTENFSQLLKHLGKPAMRTNIFVNLPVADPTRSIAFFKALGYAHNPQFTDDSAACIVISEEIYVMVLNHERFKDFTPRAIADATKTIEVILCLSCESRQHVIDLVAKAAAAGGSIYAEPKDHGFMYQHSFLDPDGHGWNLMHMTTIS